MDLVVVDVVVLDKDGAPATNLVAADFTVLAGNRPRRIVSSEYVGVPRTAATATSADQAWLAGVPSPITNRTLPEGRSILFVVDVEEIRLGEGRVALRAIAAFLASLSPLDRTGLVSLPYGTPRVDLTTNRHLIIDATELIAGASRRMASAEMTPGEAQAISKGDRDVVAAYWERVIGLPRQEAGGITGACPGPSRRPIEPPSQVSSDCREKADRALDGFRKHTRSIVNSLRSLAMAMEPLDGPKAIVLVSEGIYNDPSVRADLRAFAATAERARVALYGLHLDTPLMEASAAGGPTMTARSLDDHIGFDSMVELARAARGTAFRVVASPTNALKQVDRELSGYYLLTFERSAEDRDGDHVGIEVRVNRAGVDVRARSEFVPHPRVPPPSTAPRVALDPRAAMGTVLRWPAPLAEVPIDLDSFMMPIDVGSSDVRVMIAAEIGAGSHPVDIGFEVKNAAGQVVADTFDPKAQLRPIPAQRALYAATIVVQPGQYLLTFGVIDADGRRGSVTQTIDVKAWPAGPLRISSAMLGEVSGGAFRPMVRVEGSDTVAVRVEVHAASLDAFASDEVRIDIVGGTGPPAPFTVVGRLIGAAGSLRRAATTIVDIRDLPRGDYVVRVTLESRNGQVLAQPSRRFRK